MSNFEGANISTGIGTGLAQVPQFNRTNHFIDMLYQQEQRKKEMGYQDYLATERELNKQLANVRSQDIPELRDLYNTQKTLHQRLLFDNQLQRNTKSYSEAEKEYNDANLKFMQGVNGSIETQNFDKALSQDMLEHDYNYGNDARKILDQASQLPTSKRIPSGYNSVDTYMQGAPGNFDWQKSIHDAMGTPKNYIGQRTLSPDKTEYLTPSFSGTANPAQLQQSLLGELAQKQASKSATYQYSLLTPDQINAVNQAYDAMLQTEFDKWQVQKPNLDAPTDAPASVKYVSYLAKLHALNNVPTVGQTTHEPNIASQREFDLKKLAIEQANRAYDLGLAEKYREAYHKFASSTNTKDQEKILDGVIDQQYDNGKDKVRGFSIQGEHFVGRPISIPTAINANYLKNSTHYETQKDPATGQLIKDKNGQVAQFVVQPKWYISSDKKYLIPVYATGEKTKGGKDILTTKKDDFVPIINYKADLGKVYLAKKAAGEELSDDEFTSGDEGDNGYTSESTNLSISGSGSSRPPLSSFVKPK